MYPHTHDVAASKSGRENHWGRGSFQESLIHLSVKVVTDICKPEPSNIMHLQRVLVFPQPEVEVMIEHNDVNLVSCLHNIILALTSCSLLARQAISTYNCLLSRSAVTTRKT